ncbi:MAG: BatD family protein [Planctomycetaceae bacterium]|nr:BatD family protein [Planctomycetaceae bacterium]
MLPCALMLLALLGCRSSSDEGEDAPATDSSPGAGQVLTSKTERGPLTVELELSPEKPQLSDEPRLTVTVTAADGVVVTMPPFGRAMGEFVIRDFYEPPPQTRNGDQVLRQVYTLEPQVAGTLLLQPMTVTFTDNRQQGDGKSHEVTTEPLKVEVSTMFGENVPSLLDLQPAEQPVALPEPVDYKAWGWGAGGAVVLLGLLWFGLRRWKQERPVVVRSPHELATEELNELLASGLSSTDVKEFFVQLTKVVRRFIERSTGVKAPEQTTEEFLREVSTTTVFSETDRTRLSGFLVSADLVKFAGFQPEAEAIADSTKRAEEFINLPLGYADSEVTA